MKKEIGIFLVILSLFLMGVIIVQAVKANYAYDRDIRSYWNLADKSSTIVKKLEYIDKFVKALESGNFEGKYNALFFNTLDNSFDKNLEALKSLQGRLYEIQKMDILSFQYQSAIQQITEQEQGEAYKMLKVFYSIWYKENHFFLWEWIEIINWIFTVIIFVVGIIMIVSDYLEY